GHTTLKRAVVRALEDVERSGELADILRRYELAPIGEVCADCGAAIRAGAWIGFVPVVAFQAGTTRRRGAPVWLDGFPVCLAARGTGRPAGPGGPRVAAAPVAVGGGRRGGSFGPGSNWPGGARLWAAGERPALGPPAAIRLDGPRGQPRRAPAVAAT